MMADGNATVSIYTEDDSLQGSTVSYDLLLDLTDGQVDMHVTTASVTYIAAPPSENSAPYFDPELTGMIQIYKQSSEYEWRFVLPQALDDDLQDTVTVTYDLSQVEEFMELRA